MPVMPMPTCAPVIFRTPAAICAATVSLTAPSASMTCGVDTQERRLHGIAVADHAAFDVVGAPGEIREPFQDEATGTGFRRGEPPATVLQQPADDQLNRLTVGAIDVVTENRRRAPSLELQNRRSRFG